MATFSPLGPIDPASLSATHEEEEKSAPWIIRKLVGSMTGRIVMSSYESLRAAGTSIVCLSPWGDSSPFLLPCIRFRDLAVHTIVAATGGMAVVAAPVMGSVGAEVIGAFGDTILVELGLHAGFQLTTAAANDLVIEKPLKSLIPIHEKRLSTTAVKVLLITLKYKMTMTDAALGFFRSSIHTDNSLFSTVKDYLAVEKGWFSPYLFASARRPVIPRTMTPDVVFCHGPFLEGDYRIGQTLLSESAMVITFCSLVPTSLAAADKKPTHHSLSIPKLSNLLRSRPPSPTEPEVKHTPLPPPPQPRRMVIVLVGLKPHRSLWTTSARPGESVINYILLNGCPAIVVPVKVGAPLVAWDTLTLEDLWKITLPTEDIDTEETGGTLGGIVKVLFEYVDMCVDWERFVVTGSSGDEASPGPTEPRKALKVALSLLVAAAIRSKDSKEAKKEVDKERSGIAMWRIL
ncbi:hypothetical protein MIND_01372400 [Mycena indigotica]|uniref:Uncharacterized protein n=1 Tax=Mycena indigotica TaxID=2126181 RepID=A0A8H6RZP5_9AGAR|nr:uncharacterized protein MIND_01372400 [Mycena indigotica]KAF7289971.1 hypothetical protein MIND_01372400 [Mycena indigotica]